MSASFFRIRASTVCRPAAVIATAGRLDVSSLLDTPETDNKAWCVCTGRLIACVRHAPRRALLRGAVVPWAIPPGPLPRQRARALRRRAGGLFRNCRPVPAGSLPPLTLRLDCSADPLCHFLASAVARV